MCTFHASRMIIPCYEIFESELVEITFDYWTNFCLTLCAACGVSCAKKLLSEIAEPEPSTPADAPQIVFTAQPTTSSPAPSSIYIPLKDRSSPSDTSIQMVPDVDTSFSHGKNYLGTLSTGIDLDSTLGSQVANSSIRIIQTITII